MMGDSSTQVRYGDIHRYATLAKSAYADAPSIKRTHGDAALVRELVGSRMQFVLVNDPDETVQWIAIRGTFNPTNVLVDGRVKVVREPRLGAYFHGGFLRSAQEAYTAIRPLLDPRKQIRITGHSLGGAVAAILTGFLAEDPAGFTLGRTITFGQPMVTDIKGTRRLQKHSPLRVVNRWDPVAMLPLILSRTHFEFPPTILFHHFGSQLTLYPDRRPRLSAAGLLANVVFGYKRFLVNHFLDLYLQRLAALAD
jgi:triacylglycerol lipase